VGRLPDIPNVPYLDVVAALNDIGNTLTVFCVNRSLHTDIPTSVRIDGFASASKVEIQTLRGSSIDDANSEDDPEQVIPVRTEEQFKADGLQHVFPHESVTVLVFHKNS
jgi:alpha-N-arabinofuranosidase